MLEKVVGDFDRNVQSVYELANFDRFIMVFAIEQVSRLNARLSPRFANPADNGEHTLQALRNVRQSDSLRHNYRTIANQGAVLLVSYLGPPSPTFFGGQSLWHSVAGIALNCSAKNWG